MISYPFLFSCYFFGFWAFTEPSHGSLSSLAYSRFAASLFCKSLQMFWFINNFNLCSVPQSSRSPCLIRFLFRIWKDHIIHLCVQHSEISCKTRWIETHRGACEKAAVIVCPVPRLIAVYKRVKCFKVSRLIGEEVSCPTELCLFPHLFYLWGKKPMFTSALIWLLNMYWSNKPKQTLTYH